VQICDKRGTWHRPLDPECTCITCKSYTRAFVHNLIGRGLPFASNLVTYHNIAYMQRLTRGIQQAIKEQRFPEFVRDYLRRTYPSGDFPAWAVNGLRMAGIEVF
jgi:queuine tRNA-ribosyltransferase catalytic subunit